MYLLIGSIICVTTAMYAAGYWYFKYQKIQSEHRLSLNICDTAIKKLRGKIKSNIMEDLDMATTPQILKELTRRPNLQFVMLIPEFDEEENPVSCGALTSGLDTEQALQILDLARMYFEEEDYE